MSSCSASLVPAASLGRGNAGVPRSRLARRWSRVVPPGARPEETPGGVQLGLDTQGQDAHVLPVQVSWRSRRARLGGWTPRRTRQRAEVQTSAHVPGSPHKCGPVLRDSSARQPTASCNRHANNAAAALRGGGPLIPGEADARPLEIDSTTDSGTAGRGSVGSGGGRCFCGAVRALP